MREIKDKEKFVELRAQGLSFDKIAKELKVAKQTLINWSKELELEITNLKALELEALYEKYYLSKQHRVTTFGDLLSKLREEISKRDLSEIPIDKLLTIYLNYDKQLKEEIVEPSFKSSEEIEDSKLDKHLLQDLTTPASNRRKLKVG